MSRRGWGLVIGSHISASMALGIALWLFLTPSTAPERAPQEVRYATYAVALLFAAISVGTIVGLLLVGRSWVPAIYLWLLPLGIVALPAIDPSAAYFVYVGATSRVAGGFALIASGIWAFGVPVGAVAVLGGRIGGWAAPRIPSGVRSGRAR